MMEAKSNPRPHPTTNDGAECVSLTIWAQAGYEKDEQASRVWCEHHKKCFVCQTWIDEQGLWRGEWQV